jgi:hypothetical protein
MRIQLDLDEAGAELVDELKRLTGCRTYKDLFNNAISLLDWSVRQGIQGRKITSVDVHNENCRELVMPALQYATMLTKKESEASKELSTEPILSRS